MSEEMDSDALVRRLAGAGRVSVDTGADEAALALTRVLEDPQVRAAFDRGGRRRRWSPRARAVVTLVTASLVAGLGIAAPAVALAMFAAQTGRFGDPTTSTEEDSTEWLDLSAADLPDAVAAAYPAGLLLPPSVERADAVAKVQAIFDRFAADGGEAQTGLAATTFEFWANCAWTNEWLVADELDDQTRRERAVQWLSEPGNFPSIVANDGGGVVDQMLEAADSAAQGDRESVEDSYRYGNCSDMLGDKE